MKLLVTGAAGFIGHHFVRYVLDKHPDATVVCLDRIDYAGDMNRLPRSDRIAFVHHDLRAEINERVGRLVVDGCGRFDDRPFDHVVHMAAGSHVDRSVKDPVGFVLDNVVGTAHLFEFFRTRNALRSGGKILYFSTDEVFGPASVSWIDDDEDGVRKLFIPTGFDPWAGFNPTNPYAASKAAAECLCTAYASTYSLPILVTHCTNVFGERQHREKFIPLVIDQIRRGETVKIHANGGTPSSRFYTYVDNVSSAVLHVLLRGKCLDGTDGQGKYNISGDVEMSNLDVAIMVSGMMKKPLHYELVDFVPGRPRHDMRYAVDGGELARMGWVQEVSFADGLARVVRSEM